MWSSCEEGKTCSIVTISSVGRLTIVQDTWIGHEIIILASADIEIGAYVNIAPRVYIGTGTHEIDTNGISIAGRGYSLPIIIGNGSWICTCSTIIAGVKIGKKSIIAAGSVVTRDVPDGQLWGGIPAKYIRQLE